MIHKILLCVFAVLMSTNFSASAEDLVGVSDIPMYCDLIEEYEYKVLEYSAPKPTENDSQAPHIVEEYGVTYNLKWMPADFEVPIELKTFIADNRIDGAVIIPDHKVGSDGVFARLIRTIEKKMVLVVAESIISSPEMIIKKLMRITAAQEARIRELRSVVQVNEEEKGWKARFARTIEEGIKKLTGGDTKTSIDFDKVLIEESGTFGEIFPGKKTTLTIGDQGPYEIGIKEMESAITSVENIPVHLMLKILFKDENVLYPEDLYIGEDEGLYSCRYYAFF